MKRPGDIRRSSLPPRETRIARSPLRKHGRPASETERIYGPPERRKWVKAQPCIVVLGMCKGPIENAHVVKGDGGTSYKASAEFVAPMCRHHHRTLHSVGPLTFQRIFRVDLAALAAETERRWQERAS